MEMIIMIKKLTDTINNFDLKVKKIMTSGLYFSFVIAVIGSLFLLYYISFKSSNFIYYIGIKIITLSLSFGASFFASALAIDRIKKDLA